MTILYIEIPDNILTLPENSRTAMESIAREALMVRLYADKNISAHQATQVLGITREEFSHILARYGEIESDIATELEAEIRHQTELLQPRTSLGRKMAETRARIIVSGEQLLDWDEIEQEIAERRGGIEERLA